jgi:predicted dehydrogenase
MARTDPAALTRRSFLSRSAAAGAASSAFTIIRPELVRGAGPERLRAGLVGCGGRGTEAAIDLLAGDPNTELVALGDIFEDHLESSLRQMHDPKFLMDSGAKRMADFTGKPPAEVFESVRNRIKVDAEHRFSSFDAFKKVLASDIDIVLLCTPPGYRPEHFEAAVNARKHVFTEKPIATDPVGTRRFMAAANRAGQLKLTVVAGTMRRSQKECIETVRKIRDGAIGDVVALSANFLSTPVMHAEARDPRWGDMEWQHRNWYSFIWICGGQLVEQHVHNIDFCNWVMGTHPVSAVASGGVAWRPARELYGNIYDHLSADFVYPNGVHLSSTCRQYPSVCFRKRWNLFTGTKGHSDGMDMGTPGLDPYVREHIRLVDSIRGKGPYCNDGMEVAESTLTCIMGRESAYSGMEITWDMIMASKQDLQPKAFDYNLAMEVPPVPVPGRYKFI